jgi:hypothetical protein
MSARKRFDRELFNETDKLAREAVKELFADTTKYIIIDNPKKMGVDLQVFEPLKSTEPVFNVECEIKKVWKEKDFQYESVQFPQRKAKYAQLDKKTIFVMFNADLTAYLTVTSDDLLSSPCVEVPNRYVYKGEYFYQVPLTKVKFNSIKKSIKEILK